MRAQIRVGPAGSSILSIHRNGTYLVTHHSGEVHAEAEEGLFYRDTRFLSHYELTINGRKWLPLQAVSLSYYENRLYSTNPELSQVDGDNIPAYSLTLQIDRQIGSGLHERLTLHNYTRSSQKLRLRVRIDADFCDFFDVRANRYLSRGARDSHWDPGRRELTITYSNEGFRRKLIYKVDCDTELHFSAGQFLFAIELRPGEAWSSLNHFVVCDNDAQPANPDDSESARLCQESFDRWTSATTRIAASNRNLCDVYDQARDDIGGLRIHEHDISREIWIPAAGVPWYVTLFGRDSLIVAYQSMMMTQGFAFGALAKLAELQSHIDDPYRDAEPGKIIHEIRCGELAYFHKIPHTPYYGSADATILYLIVLSELFRWTGNRSALERFRAPADACLKWIDRFGDRDGDGFQEYQTRSTSGYYNQGWKDSGDAVLYPNGSLVELPIATCELQGYAYDAKLRAADLYQALGEGRKADRLRSQADDLRELFHRTFWLRDLEYVAFCLDGQKRPVPTVASNAGHCLWSGILDREQAEKVAQRLFAPDMWTGWGIRTLTAENPAYNPLAYQRGSVWPHDNGIIADGLSRYGHADLAGRVAQGIFEAASAFENFRLPELFAGFSRRSHPFPVQYHDASVPQAWAAGSVFHLLRSILGIHPDVPNGRIHVAPSLPDWMNDITVENLTIGGEPMRLRFQRIGGKSTFDVLEHSGKLKIEEGPPPWFVS